jgi:hypothetical protein
MSPTRSPIFLLAGMPRAGTAWCFEILTALTVATGGSDARIIREKYKLEKYLTAGNTVFNPLLPDLMMIIYPWWRGEKFAVKTHESSETYPRRVLSRWLFKGLIAKKIFIPIHMYRDPRDAMLSAYEYGKRKPDSRGGAYFARSVPSIQAGIPWMKRYLEQNWRTWAAYQDILTIRYEDMVTDYDANINRIIEYLKLDISKDAASEIIEKYRRTNTNRPRGVHLYKGVAGRFRESFSAEEVEQANQAFGPYLDRMGYPR